MEMNPNHPTTHAVRDQWHKIAMLLVLMMGERKVVIPADMVSNLADVDGAAITIKFTDAGIHLEIVAAEEADRLAHQEGGLPA